MAQTINTFIKSKLNKDLDARLLPNGEYRDAYNVQVSKSEGPNVGSLENVLGNKEEINFDTATGIGANWYCIGYVTNESDSSAYLFLTDYTDDTPSNYTYSTSANNAIIKYTASGTSSLGTTNLLVSGAFLNFSRTHPIYGVNLLENLLYWTDNRNQPRVINWDTAISTAGYYTTEDQISVAKYNPYNSMYVWESAHSSATVPYQTTMQDVTSLYRPNGGQANVNDPGGFAGGTTVEIDSIKGNILPAGGPNVANPYSATGADIFYIAGDGTVTSTSRTVVSYDASTNILTASAALPALSDNTVLVFNPNYFYDKNYAGDSDYLENKFVRFSYRYKFDDGQYSLIAPFTQECFIPKQDGYFMYVNNGDDIPKKDDQTDSYRSTIVSFMENKVDKIKLRVPLPYAANTLETNLKITEMDILYKESDGLSVKVIDTIPVADIATASTSTLIYDYTYLSKKPYKTLPSDELTRVADQIPVRALAQEVSGNRIIYGNYQNKHTPKDTLNYNVAVDEKEAFSLQDGTATATAPTGSVTAGTTITIGTVVGTIMVGSIVTSSTGGVTIPANTLVTGGNLSTTLTLNNNVTLVNPTALVFTAVGPDTQTVSKVEYPNSNLKQNRNYQVGVVLSDRYGRQSTVVLSNNETLSTIGNSSFIGDTVYSAYNGEGVQPEDWPGDSLKVLFNDPISPSNLDPNTMWPGIYNGDSTSGNYNPLGWYSYKIVVKQTEQEYYNVYLPGIMAAYPEDQTLELGGTSFTTLINDNINKVPRDLTELGPAQKQFRSSVQLFGRVENSSTAPSYIGDVIQNIGDTNIPYFPGRTTDTVSTVSTLDDLFSYNPMDPPRPNYYPAFYALESNPLIAKVSTNSQIGQIATTNYSVSSGLVDTQAGTALTDNGGSVTGTTFSIDNISGNIAVDSTVTGIGIVGTVFVTNYNTSVSPAQITVNETLTLGNNVALTFNSDDVSSSTILIKNVIGTPVAGSYITGPGISEGVFVGNYTPGTSSTGTIDVVDSSNAAYNISVSQNDRLDFWPGFDHPDLGTLIRPGIQYLAVYETEPVESLLDIFWETSSSGIISDLNTLILNSTGGAAELSSFNISNWTEGLASGSDILNADFTLQDGFGVDIPSGDIDSVTLDSAVDGNGIDRQLAANGGPYFSLAAGAAGYNNIVTTANYYNNIYFSSPTNDPNRIFTFTFSTTTSVGGEVSNNTFTQVGGPSNVTPSRTGTIDPADGDTIYKSRIDTTVIATCDFKNGAHNTALQWKDLDLSFQSITNLAGDEVKDLGYFALAVTQTGTVQRAEITINNPALPIDIYDITVQAVDAGISPVATYNFSVDFRTAVNYSENAWLWTKGCYEGVSWSVILFEVTTSGIPANKGWYGWLPPDRDGTINDIADGSVITLDRTNAYTSCPTDGGPGPDYGGTLFFYAQAVPDQTGLNALMDIMLCVQGLNGAMGGGLDCPPGACTDVPGCGSSGCYEGYSYDYGTGSPSDCGGQEDPAIINVSSYSIEVI